MLDLVHGIGCEVYAAELRIESATRVSGVRSTHGWAADKQVFFVIDFLPRLCPSKCSRMAPYAGRRSGGRISGKQIKAIFTQSAADELLVVRVGISGTSVEGAQKNLAAEIPHWDFDAVVRANQQDWGRALGVLNAELPSQALNQTFATGAYHGLVAPAAFNDVDGTYRGQDHKNYPNPGFTKYTTLSIWDIYRGEFPFLMLMQPHRVGDIVKTPLADYRQLDQHSLPVWPLWGNGDLVHDRFSRGRHDRGRVRARSA